MRQLSRGCMRCAVIAYLPFLDRIGFIPSKKYVTQHEIATYTDKLVEYCGLEPHIRFSTKVTSINYVGTGPLANPALMARPKVAIVATMQRLVVNANRPSVPRMPEVAGMQQFKGASFHTAQWDYGVDLKAKAHVGIIGTGASAAQVITSIADEVETLTVFQRSATWALPRDDEPTPPEIVEAFRKGGYSESLRHVDWQNGTPRDSELPFNFDMLHDKEANDKIYSAIVKRIHHSGWTTQNWRRC